MCPRSSPALLLALLAAGCACDPFMATPVTSAPGAVGATEALSSADTAAPQDELPGGDTGIESEESDPDSGVVPPDSGVIPPDSGVIPVDSGVVPSDSGTDPADSGADPAETGTDPVDTGTEPVDTGTAPVDTGTEPVDTGTAPVDTGTEPVDTGTAPVDTGTGPFDTGTEPADTGMGPFDTGTEPVDTGTAPFDTGTATVDTGTDPLDTGTDPVDTGTDPVDTGTSVADELCDGEDNDGDGLIDEDAIDGVSVWADADGDGFGDVELASTGCAGDAGTVTNGDDCDDAQSAVYPGALELCNDVDDDCDGTVDQGAVDAPVGYRDNDADGFGGESVVGDCDGLDASVVLVGGDCNDDVAYIYPDADEFCDGIDTNCDDDADAGALDALTWFADADEDAFGDIATSITACAAPTGYVPDLSDCDDTNADVAPDGIEVCNGRDDDCSGIVDDNGADCAVEDTGDTADTASGGVDTGDTAPYTPPPTDTGDTAPYTPPPADSGDTGSGGGGGSDTSDTGSGGGGGTDTGEDCTVTWYMDVDADGRGDTTTGVVGCQPDASWVLYGGDCDDLDPDVRPGRDELCNGIDDDCDGDVDIEPVDSYAFFGDADGDGYGLGSHFLRTCSSTVAGYASRGGDCDDADALVSPVGIETCDGIDNNCDGEADETTAVDALTWYRDTDGDGVGGDSDRTACTQPTGSVSSTGDCDDEDPATYPGAVEVCDDLDNDCNGAIDDAATVGARWFYADSDADGYGDAALPVWGCSTPVGYADDATDCDDADAGSYPGRRESCDGADNDCDGSVDEAGASGELTWYVDADADGSGSLASRTQACDLPAGYAASHDDCDDAEPLATPGNAEVCGDGIDNDCDGVSARCGPWGDRDLADGDTWISGDASDDLTGSSVIFLDDVDGDGLDDFAVGAPANDYGGTNTGTIWVATGAPTGEIDPVSTTARVYGATSDEQVGWSMANPGDVDGDGLGDLFVGAYGGDPSGFNSGAAYLVSGVSGDMDAAAQRLVLTGATSLDWAGYAVDAGYDQDGDGADDLLVGAPYEDHGGSKAGTAYVVSGTLTGTVSLATQPALYGEVSLDRAGTALGFGGDLNADGFADVVVGAWSESTVGLRAGAVYVVYGPVTTSASLSTADVKLLGVSVGERAGSAVKGAGDMDEDGYDDLLLGAPWGSRAYLVAGNGLTSGSLSGAAATFTQEASGSRLGASFSSGDVDGDGHLDAVIGAWGRSVKGSEAGATYVVRGPMSGTVLLANADAELGGHDVDDVAGTAVAADGDLDADGFDDVIVGAPGAPGAWVFYGSTP